MYYSGKHQTSSTRVHSRSAALVKAIASMSENLGGSRALSEIVDSVLSRGSEDRSATQEDDTETQLKLLNIIIKHGIQSKHKPEGIEQAEWLVKCLAAIEIICDGKHLLLNRHNEEANTTTFKWIISSLIPLLSSTEETLLNAVKQAIITIIHLITARLHIFSYKREIKTYLLSTFDTYVNNLFRNTNHENFYSLALITVNLFSLLTDSELEKKLMIDRSSDQKFESSIRKIDLAISSMVRPASKEKLDIVKSNMIVNVLYYSINGEYIHYSRLKFLFGYLQESLCASTINQFPSTQLTISYSLLLTLKKCILLDSMDLFRNSLQLQIIMETTEKYNLSPTVAKVLTFISFILSGSQEHPFVHSPFQNPDFEGVRVQIMESLFQEIPEKSVVRGLPFQIKDSEDLASWYEETKKFMESSRSLSQIDLYLIIGSIGQIICFESNFLHSKDSLCSLCCQPCIKLREIDTQRASLPETSNLKVILDLVSTKWSTADSGYVILNMAYLSTLHRLFTHYQPPKITPSCPIYLYLQKQLVSTNRDVRILTSRIIPLYVLSKHNLYEENSNIIFKLLDDIDVKTNQFLIETVVLVWGQLALASDGDRLHAILLKLVNFLGSSNSFESTVAFHELNMVAIAKEKTPWQLLSHLLPDLSIYIAQRLTTKRQMGEKIADFVGVPLNTILSRTSSYTVPYLFTNYKSDTIGEIAKVSGVSRLDLFLNNRPRVIAVLLTTVPDITESKLHTILTNTCPELKRYKLNDIFTATYSVWEVLKLYSSEAKNKSLILNSIMFILKATDPSKPTIATFFQNNILAVIQNFFDTIRDRKGLQPYVEKLKSIHAVEFLAEISGASIVSALPQIYTCLLAALDDTYLRESTLRCWRVIADNLEEVHLLTLLDQSVAIIVQKWGTLDEKCKIEAKKIISVLFDKSESFRVKHIYTFYSLAENDELVETYTKVNNAIQKADKPIALLGDITRRCKSDNKIVVMQALIDLSRFLKRYQSLFFSTFLQKSSFAVSSLLATLFDILYRFKYSDEISIQSSKCLGMIGALDPTRFEVEKSKEQPIIASDFEDYKEKVMFLMKFLNNFLVPAFWSSNHPNNQLFLAYAMQEILKLCGLDSSRVNLAKLAPGTNEHALWSQFSDIARSTLTPLVSSKYTASVGSYEPLSYPIFTASRDHTKWIRLLTLDLLKRAKGGDAGVIFEICQSLIKDQDVSFSTFILPYAALHLITTGNDDDLENIRTEIMAVLSTDIDKVHHLAKDSVRLSYESIFNLLDYLRKWIFARKQLLKRKNIKKTDRSITKVNEVLDSIPQQLMAKRSFQANSFERSILYLELCQKSNNNELPDMNTISQLQSMYASIGDFDALDGSLKRFSAESLKDRITQLEFSDHWKMAQECFETLGAETSDSDAMETDTRLMKSLFDHELYDKVLIKLDFLANGFNIPDEWLTLGLEASILSGDIKKILEWIEKFEFHESVGNSQNLVNYHVAKALIHAKNKDLDSFEASLNNVMLIVGSGLGLNKSPSLHKNHPSLVLLHGLSDLESIISRGTNFSHLKQLMDLKLKHAGNEFKTTWMISSFRKTGNILSGTKQNMRDIADIWMELSKISRKHKRLDLATSSIMHATRFESVNTDLEYAKLLWEEGDRPSALKIVDKLRNDQHLMNAPARDRASIQLKYTQWLDESNNSSSGKIIEEYSAAIRLDQGWDKPYHSLGKYYNKILDLKRTVISERVNPKDFSGEYERRTISFYMKTLQCGSQYLYEALPKLITVWLDFAERISEVPEQLSDPQKVTILTDRGKNLQNIHDEIVKYAERIPKYFWYTVLSQLLSRLLHDHKKASQIIIMLAQIVVQEYPAHALWSVLAQYKSNKPERPKKAKKILDLFSSSESKDSSVSNATILESSKKLFNQLVDVSKRVLPKSKGPLSLRDDFEFDSSVTPSPLVVPVKTNFDITLPSSVQTMRSHNPFPNSSRVTIDKFENRVDVLSSMQQPRHLYLRGSNGLSYGILCKPNDDLRKDAKLMEFTTMVDHLLKKDYESGQRNLHIKTYAVIPLNETYGIIEWVDNSRTMRDILKVHYYNINVVLDIGAIKKVLDKDCDASEKAELFKRDILTRYQPVLYQWFIENFPDPTSWYEARNNYTRTTAVMSMVGYILGLGDRHGENLLFNEKDGGILHVDFDCLFEKGLELAVPERVPFRLTPNMVDAFGITGVEGTFRKSSEVTLTLLRNNETALMNILESFLHDPIMDWSQKRRSKNTPQTALSTIRRKIRGILDKEGLPMSVQGQADFLIQQATSLENLSQMYIGWMAFW